MTELTCATCKYIGGVSWDTGCRQDHSCGKSDERRRDAMKPSGDFAQDFISNFCTFFDAGARRKACRYYEEAPPLSADEAALLSKFDADGNALFPFFSQENIAAERHPEKLFRRDFSADLRYGQVRAYRLTDLGRIVVRRLSAAEGSAP